MRVFSVFVAGVVAATVATGVSTAGAQDTVNCNDLVATIVGTDGDDIIQGTWQADVIAGLGGNDTITGLSGDDVICGGVGDDTISGASGADTILGGPGNDTLAGDSQNDTIHGGDGDDDINGGPGDDTLDGGNGFDLVDGLWQTDTCDDAETALNCETQTNNGEPDNPDGSSDPEPFTCNGLQATIIGTEGDDTIQGTWQADVIVAFGGNDTINSGSGEDTICAGDGDDVINGQSQDDWIDAGPGNDTVSGASGADTILGGPGNDTLAGDSQNDTIHGGDGDDDINGGPGDDTLDGGNGFDLVDGLWQTDTCDDAETALNCETQTNNGEPEPPAETASLEILAPVTGASVTGVVEIRVSAELLPDTSEVVVFAGGVRLGIVDGAGALLWDTDGFDGPTELRAVSLTPGGAAQSEFVGVEVRNGVDPDDDSVPSELEALAGLNPESSDSDGDGLGDFFELSVLGLDPVSPDVAGDADGDGLSAEAEQLLGTSPLLADSDLDGWSDADEALAGGYPTDPDSDGDGLLDGTEIAAGTSPFIQDSDGDGVLDGDEQLVVEVESSGVRGLLTGSGELSGGFTAEAIDGSSLADIAALGATYDLSLSGDAVLESAELSIPYQPEPGTEPVVARWNAAVGMWLPASDPSDQVVGADAIRFTTNAFSIYTVADRRALANAVITNQCAAPSTTGAVLTPMTLLSDLPMTDLTIDEGEIWYVLADGRLYSGFDAPTQPLTGTDFGSVGDGLFAAIEDGFDVTTYRVSTGQLVDTREVSAGDSDIYTPMGRNGLLWVSSDGPFVALTSDGNQTFVDRPPVGYPADGTGVFFNESLFLPGGEARNLRLRSTVDFSLLASADATPLPGSQFRSVAGVTSNGTHVAGVIDRFSSEVFIAALNGNTIEFSDAIIIPGDEERFLASTVDSAGNFVFVSQDVVEDRSGPFGLHFRRYDTAGALLEESFLPYTPRFSLTRATTYINGTTLWFTVQTNEFGGVATSASPLANVGDALVEVNLDGGFPSVVQAIDTGSGIDSDLDGLPDCVEQDLRFGRRIVQSNPQDADTDDDGLDDGEEVLLISPSAATELAIEAGATPSAANFLFGSIDESSRIAIVRADPGVPDSDLDTLTDPVELEAGTDPFLPDSDFDGVDDRFELIVGTNPNAAETLGAIPRPERLEDCTGPFALFFEETVYVANGETVSGCVDFPESSCTALYKQGVGEIADCQGEGAYRAILAAASAPGTLTILERSADSNDALWAIPTRDTRTNVRQPLRYRPASRPAPPKTDIRWRLIEEATRTYIGQVDAAVAAATGSAERLDAVFVEIVDDAIASRTLLHEQERRNLRSVVRRCTHGTDGKPSEASRHVATNANGQVRNWDSFTNARGGQTISDAGALGFIRNEQGDLDHLCQVTPIYAPGEIRGNVQSGAGAVSLSFTTHHIRMALGDTPIPTTPAGERITATNQPNDWEQWNDGVVLEPFWTLLTRLESGAPSANGVSSWYDRVAFMCGRTRTLPGRQIGSGCDEFPFYTTAQGGPFSASITKPAGPASLHWVPGIPDPNFDNEISAQGLDIQGFNRECGPDDGNVFFVIPIPDIRPAINATGLINIQPGYPLPTGAEFFRSRYICQS